MHFTYCTFLLFLSTNKKHDSYDYKYQRLFSIAKAKDNEALVQHKIIFNKENQILYQCANIGFSFSLKILWAMFVSQKWSEMKICLKHATFTGFNVYENNDLRKILVLKMIFNLKFKLQWKYIKRKVSVCLNVYYAWCEICPACITKKFTFCKYFVRVCGWCMHLVCYRSVQSRNMTVFFSILLPSKKEKNRFLLLSYFCKPWYDAIGKIYLSCHMFSCEHFFIELYQTRIKIFAQNQYTEKGVDISQCLMTNALFL